MQLTENVKFILARLNEKGYRADVVGGPVRDFLRGVTPDDYDITTDASPEEIKSAFSDKRTVDTGIKHGTVTVMLDKKPYEITTYRIDGEYKDSRHPESVEFTKDISLDLSRRDFTVNAIAYNERDGFTDLFSGISDIENKILRAVGDAEIRFTEDALRILRLVRFASTLGFLVEEKTGKAAFSKMHLLRQISAERIYTEWKKMLSGSNAYDVLLKYREIFEFIIPEITDFSLPDRALFNSSDYATRFFSLFVKNGVGNPELFLSATSSLKTDSQIKNTGVLVLSSIGKYDFWDGNLLSLLMELGLDGALALSRLEILIGGAPLGCDLRISALSESGEAYRLSDLAINGKDVESLGIAGKEIGVTLKALLSAVVFGKCKNEKAELLAYAKNIISATKIT